MRRAFTLIELMISIMILSILMLFLYKSYSSLNRSNTLLAKEVKQISRLELLKKTVYEDFTVAFKKSIRVIHQSKDEDILFFQTKHSIHRRINPYVAYIIKEKTFYRLESFKPFKKYPLPADSEFVADELGKVEILRLYKSQNTNKQTYFFHLLFKNKSEIVLKIKILNKG